MPGTTITITNRLSAIDGPHTDFCCNKKNERYLELKALLLAHYKMSCLLLIMTSYNVLRYIDFLKVLSNYFSLACLLWPFERNFLSFADTGEQRKALKDYLSDQYVLACSPWTASGCCFVLLTYAYSLGKVCQTIWIT